MPSADVVSAPVARVEQIGQLEVHVYDYDIGSRLVR